MKQITSKTTVYSPMIGKLDGDGDLPLMITTMGK